MMPNLLAELDTAITAFSATDVHALPETVLLTETETLLETRKVLDGLIAVRLQAADVRDATVAERGRQSTSWLIEDLHLSPTEAKQRMWVARRLVEYPAIRELLLAGQISHQHALVIINCVTKLPMDWREPAEKELCVFACDHDPATLGRLCAELRIRTGADEDAEAAEARRFTNRHLTLNTTMDGMIHLNGMLDPESGAIISAALGPLVAATTGPEDTRHNAQRRADALVELARFSLCHGELPDQGGDRPQVVVTIPFNELRDGIAARQLPFGSLNGLSISPATARRLACDANIIPAVLGGESEVLDLGRSTPTWSRAQRRARRIEDKGCTWPSCQVPLSRCRIHHLKYWWEHHGPTDKDNGTHVCEFHHWLVHHTKWEIFRNPQGKIEIRRT
jgi:Domain of unknown function (DUF222)